MRSIFSIAPLLAIGLLLLGACSPSPEEPEKTWIVGSQLVDCEGEGQQVCMQVKEKPGDEWQLFYGRIEGFDYEEGYEYTIRYTEETVENPPPGEASTRWILIDVISRTLVEPSVTALMLEDKIWRMSAYRGSNGQMIETMPEVKTTAEFSAGEIGGRGGCNSYNGTYEVDGKKISFGPIISTMMACIPPVMDQERGYFNALGVVSNFEIEGGHLLLTDSEEEVVVEYQTVESAQLTGTPWMATSYNNGRGGMVSIIIGTEITAIFNEDGTLRGSAGCNNYTASYEISEEAVSIGMVAATRMYCEDPQGIMEQEGQYLAALQDAAVYNIMDGRLEIRDGSGAGVAYYAIDSSAIEPDPAVLENLEFPSDFTAAGTAPLSGGDYHEKISEDSATEIVVVLTDDIDVGTLADGSPGAATVLATNAGGSGTFYDLALVQIADGEASVLASTLLGDRVKVLSIDLEEGVIAVELVAQGDEDPMCCPTQWEKRTYAYRDGELTMTSSEVLGTVEAPELLGTTWTWMGTVSPDNPEILVDDPSKYTARFHPDGSVAINADCNIASGSYLASSGQMDIEILMTTLAACPPGSLGEVFIEQLNAAASYFFEERNLYFDLINDSGTMKFESE